MALSGGEGARPACAGLPTKSVPKKHHGENVREHYQQHACLTRKGVKGNELAGGYPAVSGSWSGQSAE
jgi:hypothetical protein